MITARTFRIGLCIAMVGIGGLVGGIGASTLASAAGPKVVVAPSVKLKNGEVVHVSGSGFKPGDTVFIVECLRSAKGESGCKVPTTIPTAVTITATGLLPRSSFKVSTGKIGNGTCGTTKANLSKCAVSVGNATGGDSAVGNIV
ncbi:MAG TPA: neocarzinostatin apoprotein domain-containing protein, partial [Acidimicrobiales bacterium]|nr:neocarzinostatin apoprotein domain-containing protein [Acidimicrobiales bacterium]